MKVSQNADWLAQAVQVLEMEQQALQAQAETLRQDGGDAFACAVHRILSLEGRLVVIGMGKSGIIAKKVAATFASTGTPAFFVHAAEAQHGDLGMITRQDVVLALSHSGETDELRGVLPVIKRLGTPLIAMTGNIHSTLANYADIVLHVPVQQEACPMNLAPTVSTTAALALGDALAVVVLKQRNFAPEDFARIHPAGSLGRKLMCVADVMHDGELPVVAPDTPLHEVIVIMSRGRMGIAGIVENGRLSGCVTDGDLRRIMESGSVDLKASVQTFMHTKPHTIGAQSLVTEAINLMETHKITVVFVAGQDGLLAGMVHMHDLLKAGVA